MQVQWHKNTSKHQSCNLLLLWCRRLSQTLGAVSSCLLRESFCSIWLKTSKILTTWRVGELLALVSCFSSLFSRNLTWLGPSSLSASWLRFQKELSGQFISSRATLLEQGMWFPQPFLWTWEVPGMEDVREEAGEEIHPHPPHPPPPCAVGRGANQSQRFTSVWHQHHSRKMLFSQCPLLVVRVRYKLLQESFAVCTHGTCSKRVSPGCPSPLKLFGSWLGLWHRSSLCFGSWPL